MKHASVYSSNRFREGILTYIRLLLNCDRRRPRARGYEIIVMPCYRYVDCGDHHSPELAAIGPCWLAWEWGRAVVYSTYLARYTNRRNSFALYPLLCIPYCAPIYHRSYFPGSWLSGRFNRDPGDIKISLRALSCVDTAMQSPVTRRISLRKNPFIVWSYNYLI